MFKVAVLNESHQTKEQAKASAWKTKSPSKMEIREVTLAEYYSLKCNGFATIPSELVLEGANTINQDIWRSSRILEFDIDNEDVNKQRYEGECYLTPEQALQMIQEVGLRPVFIYATLSDQPKHRKFRIGFYFNESITDMNLRSEVYQAIMSVIAVNNSTLCDTSCIDPARTMFGGKEGIYFDADAVVTVKDVLKARKEGVYVGGKPKATKRATTNNKKTNDQTLEMSLWIQGDVYGLRSVLADRLQAPFDLKARRPVYITGNFFEFIKTLPIADLLGLPEGKNFCCIMPDHDDHNPSANINVTENGHHLYGCFSSRCSAKELDFLGVLQRLTGRSFSQLKKLICEALNITFESTWQVQMKRTLMDDLMYLQSDRFDNDFPVLANYLKQNPIFGHWLFHIQQAIFHLNHESLTLDGRPSWFMSVRQMEAKMKAHGIKGATRTTIHRNINMLNVLGLMKKVKPEEQPLYLRKGLQQLKQDKKLQYTYDVYVLPELDYDTLKSAEEMVEFNKVNGVRKAGLSFEQVARTHNVEKAKRIYTQESEERTKSKHVDKFEQQFTKHLLNDIQVKKWSQESDILKRVRGFHGREKQLRSEQCLPGLLQRYSLKRVRVNKETRKLYNLPKSVKSNSYVIVPNQTAFETMLKHYTNLINYMIRG